MREGTKAGILVLIAAVGIGVLVLLRAPGFLTGDTGFRTILILSLAILSLTEYQKVMLPVVVVGFLWAGLDVPYQETAYAGRWAVLAMAALFGLIVWSRSPYKLDFGAVHLLAAFTVLNTLFSALGAVNRQLALLKCLSIFLLFLYLSIGGRVTFQGREVSLVHSAMKFFQSLVLLCAVLYIVDLPYWYNPNSLGAIMGMFAWPFVLWGYLIARSAQERRYSGFVVFVCATLLLLSRARAGMLAAGLSTLVILFSLRRIRLIGLAALGLLVFFLAFFLVAPENFHDYAQTVIYKPNETDRELSVLSSRRTPWEKTIKTIQEHPWFGTGLGTPEKSVEGIFTTGGYREHGNSYLTVAEGLGLLGIAPFALLLIVLLHRLQMACLWMRRSTNPAHCAVPLVWVMLAGLVHATFEDWLLSPGSYLCIGFWVITFWALDLTKRSAFSNVPAQPAVQLWAQSPQAQPSWGR